MGGALSLENSAITEELQAFRTLMDENGEDDDWMDNEIEGVHTKLSSKAEGGRHYWKGVVDIEAPIELILWVIRNQAETFDGLLEVLLDKELDSTVYAYLSKRTCESCVEDNEGLRTLRWSQQLPPPARKREFVTKEVMHKLDDTWFVLQSSVAGRKRGARAKLERTRFDTTASRQSHRLTGSTVGSRMSVELSKKAQQVPGSPKRKTLVKRAMTKNKTEMVPLDITSSPKKMKSDNPRSFRSQRKMRRGSTLNESKRAPMPKRTSVVQQHVESVVRGEVIVNGYALKALSSKRTRVTYVTCIDLVLDSADFDGSITSNTKFEMTLDMVVGLGRVLMDLERMYRYFTDKQSELVERLYRLASAEVGDLGFEKYGGTKGKAKDLQIGTHIRNKEFGHGVVTAFDMVGNTIVKYDNGEMYRYEDSEILAGDLQVVIEVGTRVDHKDYGLGTVKQFDEQGYIHVKFDKGVYSKFTKEDWDANTTEAKIKKVVGARGAGNVSMSCRKNGILDDQSIDKDRSLFPTPLNRISFVVGAEVEKVLEYVNSYKEDQEAGNLKEERMLDGEVPRSEYFSNFGIRGASQKRYERKKMTDPLSDRDFVFIHTYKQVDENTYVVLDYSVDDDSAPRVQGVVRGDVVLRGFLLEPVYEYKPGPLSALLTANKRMSTFMMDKDETSKAYTKVTYISCVDLGGFVAPKTLEAEGNNELIGVLTEMRAFFYNEDTAKGSALKATNKRLSSAKSRRIGSKRLDGSKQRRPKSRIFRK